MRAASFSVTVQPPGKNWHADENVRQKPPSHRPSAVVRAIPECYQAAGHGCPPGGEPHPLALAPAVCLRLWDVSCPPVSSQENPDSLRKRGPNPRPPNEMGLGRG